MTITEMIAELTKARDIHGDVDVMIFADEREIREPEFMGLHEVAAGEYPKSWNMPKGFKFIEI